jgi:hypothetical protein
MGCKGRIPFVAKVKANGCYPLEICLQKTYFDLSGTHKGKLLWYEDGKFNYDTDLTLSFSMKHLMPRYDPNAHHLQLYLPRKLRRHLKRKGWVELSYTSNSIYLDKHTTAGNELLIRFVDSISKYLEGN